MSSRGKKKAAFFFIKPQNIFTENISERKDISTISHLCRIFMRSYISDFDLGKDFFFI